MTALVFFAHAETNLQ